MSTLFETFAVLLNKLVDTIALHKQEVCIFGLHVMRHHLVHSCMLDCFLHLQ